MRPFAGLHGWQRREKYRAILQELFGQLAARYLHCLAGRLLFRATTRRALPHNEPLGCPSTDLNMLPIIPHYRPDPPSDLLQEAEQLALLLRVEHCDKLTPDAFSELTPQLVEEGPTLYIDDFSEIPCSTGAHDSRYLQDRARLRAGDGDLVASCADSVEGYEEYCRDSLGLGSPQWLRPLEARCPERIADACWDDAATREALIRKVRQGELKYLHPNVGIAPVWELAFLLYRETGRAVQVIAPPAPIARWANDKIAFTATAARLFGEQFVPRTESASNFASLAEKVKELSQHSVKLGLKRPNAAGGSGNLVLDAAEFRDRPLADVRRLLSERLQHFLWESHTELLIDRWETDVLCSPSAQIWIPPEPQGMPIVEGVFMQNLQGDRGAFDGAAPAEFDSDLTREIVDRSWLLARVFQRLGYLGRCSFDMILAGENLSDCRLEFIECNGRWGGTSLPMTLMNRIFGDWKQRPFAARIVIDTPGLQETSFTELQRHFGDEMFDVRTGRGELLLLTPSRLRSRGGITAIVLADSWEAASRKTATIQDRLREAAAVCAAQRSAATSSGNNSKGPTLDLPPPRSALGLPY